MRLTRSCFFKSRNISAGIWETFKKQASQFKTFFPFYYVHISSSRVIIDLLEISKCNWFWKQSIFISLFDLISTKYVAAAMQHLDFDKVSQNSSKKQTSQITLSKVLLIYPAPPPGRAKWVAREIVCSVVCELCSSASTGYPCTGAHHMAGHWSQYLVLVTCARTRTDTSLSPGPGHSPGQWHLTWYHWHQHTLWRRKN